MGLRRAGEAHHGAADGESLQAEMNRILAERQSRRLVLADRPQYPAPWAAQQPLEREIEYEGDAGEQREVEQPKQQRVAGGGRERAGDEADPERAAGHPLQIESAEMDDDGGAERGDRQIVGPQPDRQRADEEADDAGGASAAEPADGDRQAEAAQSAGRIGRRQQSRDIGADRDESGDADIEQTGLAPLHVEAEADDGVGQRHRQEERAIAEEIEDHGGDLPNRPRGRTSRMATRITKATAARHSAPIRLTVADSASPTIRPPMSAPGALPMPPRIAAAKSGSNRSSPIVGRICTNKPAMIPAIAARPAPRIQTRRTTLRLSTPANPASCGFSLTARMARPIGVRAIRRWTATTRAPASARQSSASGVARTRPNRKAICNPST